MQCLHRQKRDIIYVTCLCCFVLYSYMMFYDFVTYVSMYIFIYTECRDYLFAHHATKCYEFSIKSSRILAANDRDV